MRYALTGATGFVGTTLTRQLRDARHDVIALVRNPNRAAHLRDLGVELVQGDLNDAAALDQLLAGVDGFFHVAGWYKLGHREAATLQEVNVDGTRNVLEAAKRNDVPRIVYTSTLAVNSDTKGEVVDESYHFAGKHVSEYDRTKADAHDIAEQYAADGLPIVIVQPGIVYGPNDVGSAPGQMMQQLLAGKTVMGPSTGGGCWAHVEDIAEGHVLAMEKGKPGDNYFLAGPTATMKDAMTIVKDAAGPGATSPRPMRCSPPPSRSSRSSSALRRLRRPSRRRAPRPARRRTSVTRRRPALIWVGAPATSPPDCARQWPPSSPPEDWTHERIATPSRQ